MFQNARMRVYMNEKIRRTFNVYYIKFLSHRRTYVVVQPFFEKIIIICRPVIHVVFKESLVLSARRRVKYGLLYRTAFVKRLEIRIMAENTQASASVHPVHKLRRISFLFSTTHRIMI